MAFRGIKNYGKMDLCVLRGRRTKHDCVEAITLHASEICFSENENKNCKTVTGIILNPR